MNRHDGRIGAEAQPGRGAAFSFTLSSPPALILGLSIGYWAVLLLGRVGSPGRAGGLQLSPTLQ